MGDATELVTILKGMIDEQKAKSVILTETSRLTVAPILLDETVEISSEKLLLMSSIFPLWILGEWKLKDIARCPVTGGLYVCIQPHEAFDPNHVPSVTPALWTLVRQTAGPVIDPWAQPPAESSYMMGDKVLWTDGDIYESTIDNNVWSPATYPAGWQKV